ncbi:MAG: hypothetical protein KatS3mg110_0596 [Pirellulaceae bacterium]|nr:MAG: hypothetical protein KatS3mg110_0596 [Pirellulaceae bacterium]
MADASGGFEVSWQEVSGLASWAMRISRRKLLWLGTLGGTGLALPQLLHAEAKRVGNSSKAKSCILFFLEGGPSHIDLWDMKPEAPAEVRGEFQPIRTRLPGIVVCEHLPMLSRQMHRVTQIRSVHHKIVDHNAGSYYMLTGRSPIVGGELIVRDLPDNFPPIGSALALLRPLDELPPFVHVPEYMFNNGSDLPGQRAGFLGPAFDPFVTGDPCVKDYRVPGLELPRGLSAARLVERRSLLRRLNRAEAAGVWADSWDEFRQQAFRLITSPAARQAFDLSQEPAAVRERYGLPDREDRSVEARKFGGLPHLGQCLLLARRLIEAGVRLVTVCTGRRIDQTWDTHRNHFPLLKRSILPYFDRAFSALLEDLQQRGLWDETLVVAMGEFGRTPKLGQVTSSAGADRAGRDHWPHCYTILMAGGGVPEGCIYGASDAFGAYPVDRPVTPEDVVATIYDLLGVDPETRIRDRLGRPHTLALGTAIRNWH